MYSPRRWDAHAPRSRSSHGPRWSALSRNIRKSSQLTKSFRVTGRNASRVQARTTPIRNGSRNARAPLNQRTGSLSDLDGELVDSIGEAGGSEPVVDVHHPDPGHARREHREERREAALRDAVADAGRHRDHGPINQSSHDARQRALHPGDHHDGVGLEEQGMLGEKAMESG